MQPEYKDTQVIQNGQADHEQPSSVSLGFLAEALLATEELWSDLPAPGPLFGTEFLDAVLQGASNGR